MTHYCEALRVNTSHQFWQHSAGEMMHFTPHPITAKLILNAEVQFRFHNNGFQLYTSSRSLEILSMHAQQADIFNLDEIASADDIEYTPFLVFSAEINDRYFYNYTEVNLKQGMPSFLAMQTLSNSGPNASNFGFLGDENLIQLYDKPYSLFYSPTEQESGSKVLMLVDIRSLLAKPPLDTTPVKQTITLKLKNRAVYLRYLIMGGEQFTSLFIIDKDENVFFEYQGFEDFNGAKARVFMSTSRIDLHYPSPYRFQLKDDDSPQQAPLIETLPNADFRLTLLKHAVDDQAFVSETIVYL